MPSEERCQSCLTSSVAREIAENAGGSVYRLCAECARRLEALALRPLEWYRLAALHGPFAFYLHEDFYDQDGVALQPKQDVESTRALPVPSLHAVADDLDRLLEYVLTRWTLNEGSVSALCAHPPGATVARLEKLVGGGPAPWVESRCYEIAAQALGANAASWIETRWTCLGPSTEFAFFKAAASCLPHEAALPRALTWFEGQDEKELPRRAMALGYFKSARVLDWLEVTAKSPHSDAWGRLAACSDLSWPRLLRWLDAGRPLSLVGLDALLILAMPPSRQPMLSTASLSLAPDQPELVRKLREYEARDPAPRVTRIVEAIAARNA